MLGIDILNAVYKDNSFKVGTQVRFNDTTFVVEKTDNGTVLREYTELPSRGKMIHNYSFRELLDFLNTECTVSQKFSFFEAARRNRKMKPTIYSDSEYMNLKQALLFLSSIADNNELKALLEEDVWVV